MELDRALIKSQAKQLMRDRVFGLFIITMILSIIMGFFSTGSGIFTAFDDFDDDFGNHSSHYFDGKNPIEEFGNELDDAFDEDYFNGITGSVEPVSKVNTARVPAIVNVFSGLSNVLVIFLYSLQFGIVTLYLRLSRNEYNGFSKELTNSFRVSFDRFYIKKVGLILVKYLLIYLFSLLLIIPGIIKGYKLYFSEFIMAENPEMSIGQANRVSEKMTADHKGELFKMDLSFIGWFILVGLTFGIAAIYVVPYVFTTKALYYQNFKIRCMQEGRLTDADFMSDSQRANMYNNQNGYYNPNQNQYNNVYGNVNQMGQNPYNNCQNSYNQNPNVRYDYQQGSYAYNQNAYQNQAPVYNNVPNNMGYNAQVNGNMPNAPANQPVTATNSYNESNQANDVKPVKIAENEQNDAPVYYEPNTFVSDNRKDDVQVTEPKTFDDNSKEQE